MDRSGIIFDIKHFAIHDGPGIRTTVFFKGCPLTCPWCHNPEGIKREIEYVNLPDWKQTIGREASSAEIMAEIKKDIIFYDQSDGGATFSGGEPLLQPEFLMQLLQECKKEGIHTVLDTSGHTDPDIFASFLDAVDLFLSDFKVIDQNLHHRLTGVSNRFILKNLETLCSHQKNAHLRIPVIPGHTDSPENISQIGNYLTSLSCIKKLNLLPFHPTAAHKYARLKLKNPMAGVQSPSREQLNKIKKMLNSAGIQQPIEIGG